MLNSTFYIEDGVTGYGILPYPCVGFMFEEFYSKCGRARLTTYSGSNGICALFTITKIQ